MYSYVLQLIMNKNKVVTIRLTEADYQGLKAEARKLRMGLSAYMRMLIFGREIT